MKSITVEKALPFLLVGLQFLYAYLMVYCFNHGDETKGNFFFIGMVFITVLALITMNLLSKQDN